jgi:predicted nucleic acid-binding protein
VAGNRRFTLDSNILVYAVNGSAGEKHEAAHRIVVAAARFDCVLALQAVSEFYWVVTRKRLVRPALAAERANDLLTAFRCISASESAIRAALPHAAAERLAYWDALLITTAAEAGCDLVLTEDMHDGLLLNGVHIHHPFGSDGVLTDLTRELLDM